MARSVEDCMIEVGTSIGGDEFAKVLSKYPELDNKDLRQTAIVFSLFIESIHYLRRCGWEVEQLMGEVVDHCQMEDDID